MQRWELRAAKVYYKSQVVDVKERQGSGIFASTVTRREDRGDWFRSVDGQERSLEQALNELGDSGWEIVGTAPITTYESTGNPPHWLYLKCPKP